MQCVQAACLTRGPGSDRQNRHQNTRGGTQTYLRPNSRPNLGTKHGEEWQRPEEAVLPSVQVLQRGRPNPAR